ncbi:hypothetical protein M9194_04340 [Vibrio sp. S4M6]|uniref:hypothetical protein n=1 Tax=Vibrio sinus TaxID=2946865 RepID=UPI00202A99A6|nr:hypothetical protein [Vibrio sinus]MCL9780665.1 hypothetical protein [Vibrio sinus]
MSNSIIQLDKSLSWQRRIFSVKQRKHERGLTIAEVGMAVVLGVIILSAVFTAYNVSSKNTNLAAVQSDISSILSAAKAANVNDPSIIVDGAVGLDALGLPTNMTDPFGGPYGITTKKGTATTPATITIGGSMPDDSALCGSLNGFAGKLGAVGTSNVQASGNDTPPATKNYADCKGKTSFSIKIDL